MLSTDSPFSRTETMNTQSNELLAHPAYSARVRLRGYTGAITAAGAHTKRDAANVLITANPAWTRADHARLAELHSQAETLHESAYQKALDGAAQETFGRPFAFGDYRVCCIGSEQFSDAWKKIIRLHGYAAPKHKALAKAHLAASQSRRIA